MEAKPSLYDVYPYESHPFEQTTPENISSIARLFGLNTPDFRTARVLELGCASGGNIIPLAEIYPDASFTGVDLSRPEIEEGQMQIRETGIPNVELKTLSVTDIDKSFGEFDFIIAHGLHSWVDTDIQKEILRVSKENLSEQGVAFVSFNTLPGWNLVNSVRDLMRFHTKSIEDPTERVQQARSIMSFMIDGMEGNQSPHAKLLRDEMQLLSDKKDYYLLHDHLSETNNPVYFHEFMEQARAVGLDYLADTDLQTMLVDHLPKSVSKQLKNLKDIVSVEQYMDFFRNRRFRHTLLCHQGQQLKRNISPGDIEQFHLSSDIRCLGELNDTTLAAGYSLAFKGGSVEIKSENRISKLVFTVFHNLNRNPVTLDELVQMVVELDGGSLKADEVKEHIRAKVNFVSLVFSGVIKLRLSPGEYKRTLDEKPKTTKTVRYLIQKGALATNCRHQSVSLQPVEAMMVKYFDGEHSVDELTDIMVELEAKGDLQINQGQGSQSPEQKRDIMKNACANMLNRFTVLGFFI